MKIGDIVCWPGIIERATVGEVDGKFVSIWWPCTEYGCHTKIVPIELLTVVGKSKEKKPLRVRDRADDHQVVS